jgi:cysteine-S-conjugate beta-lyase
MSYNFDEFIDRRNSNSMKWTQYPPDVLPLWVADMDFRTPQPILDALHATLEHGVLGYEFLRRRTQEVVAARMERLYGWHVDPDWIVATPGVVSGFNIAARAVCLAGDGVLIQPPVYHMFYGIYQNIGLTQQIAPFTFAESDHILHPQLDLNTFAAAFHSNNVKTKMFLLCHPHNPTGQAFTREELRNMAEICLQNDTIIVSDEIHSELILDGPKHVPMATLSPEIADRTITLIAASKTFNVAGLFCAFAIIPNTELREKFKVANEHITGHVSSMGLIAAETALSGVCDDWLVELLPYLKANRDFMAEYLIENFPDLRFTIPNATYLAWLDFSEYVKSGRIQGSPFDFFLNEAKVAFTDGKPFGEGCENVVRLNFASPRSMLAEGLERMQKAVYKS